MSLWLLPLKWRELLSSFLLLLLSNDFFRHTHHYPFSTTFLTTIASSMSTVLRPGSDAGRGDLSKEGCSFSSGSKQFSDNLAEPHSHCVVLYQQRRGRNVPRSLSARIVGTCVLNVSVQCKFHTTTTNWCAPCKYPLCPNTDDIGHVWMKDYSMLELLTKSLYFKSKFVLNCHSVPISMNAVISCLSPSFLHIYIHYTLINES